MMTRLWQTVRYTGSINCGALLRTVETVTAIGRKKLVSSLGRKVSSAQLVKRGKIQENTPSMELCSIVLLFIFHSGMETCLFRVIVLCLFSCELELIMICELYRNMSS